MEKILSKQSDESSNNCFACSKTNPHGLQMEFWEDGEEIVSFWSPKNHYIGWKGVIHGGIIATMMDEIGEWLINKKLNTVGVTTNLNVKYRKPLKSDIGDIEIRGKITRQVRNIVVINAWIQDSKHELCSEAEIHYFTYSQEIAKKQFGFNSEQ
jgi:uncharacterized protein (TIGR00369 family)